MNAKFLLKRDRETTITSTEISDFDKLKPNLVEIKFTQLSDIENSSTSFRLAGNYLRCFGQKFEGIEVKEFNSVMSEFDGYDVYKTNDGKYVRFNSTAFVSNYKRNDLLSTVMTLYCIKVGDFPRDSFDFMKTLDKLEKIFVNIESGNTLADLYPLKNAESKPTDMATDAPTANQFNVELLFYRIDKFIRFDDFSADTIHKVTDMEISHYVNGSDDKLCADDIYSRVSPKINASGENARTIKNKVQQEVEQILFENAMMLKSETGGSIPE